MQVRYRRRPIQHTNYFASWRLIFPAAVCTVKYWASQPGPPVMAYHHQHQNIAATVVMVTALLTGSRLLAQQAAPPGADLAQFAARRHPQPVRVGDLVGRRVLQPVESRPVLGHVMQVVRLDDGSERIIIRYGGWFGFGGRPIAVPIDAMVLLGDELEVLDLTPVQLNGFQTFKASGGSPLAADELIRMGLAHPSH
jgi:hypothetical protein